MANPDFTSILAKAPSEIEKPKPLPAGTYLCTVQGMPKFDKSSKKQTPYAEFTYKILQAGEDVDKDALEEMGGIGEKTLRDTYYITENAVYRLKEMLTNCGLDEGEYGSLQEMIEASPNCQLNVFIKHTASDDGKSVYANVDSTAPVE